MYTGLLGASRDSNFVRQVEVFGFKPVSRQESEIFYTPIPPEWCYNNQVMYFPLSNKNRHDQRHWVSQTPVTFGDTEFHHGFMLDTGASVIALPTSAFKAFESELDARGIHFRYYPQKLFGVIPCNMMPSMPSWYIGYNEGVNRFRVTPSTYIVEDAARNICVVDVAKVSSGHPIIFGLPVLRTSISEFNQRNESLGICYPKSEGLSVLDKPRTPPRRNDFSIDRSSGGFEMSLLMPGIYTLLSCLMMAL
jgi:hypothetical protein